MLLHLIPLSISYHHTEPDPVRWDILSVIWIHIRKLTAWQFPQSFQGQQSFCNYNPQFHTANMQKVTISYNWSLKIFHTINLKRILRFNLELQRSSYVNREATIIRDGFADSTWKHWNRVAPVRLFCLLDTFWWQVVHEIVWFMYNPTYKYIDYRNLNASSPTCLVAPDSRHALPESDILA